MSDPRETWRVLHPLLAAVIERMDPDEYEIGPDGVLIYFPEEPRP